MKQSKDVPAVRSLAPKKSMQDISNAVEQVFGDDIKTARNVTIFLCHKHTGEKLRTIGEQFGIGDSAVSQVCKRVRSRIDQDKRLKNKIRLLEKKILV